MSMSYNEPEVTNAQNLEENHLQEITLTVTDSQDNQHTVKFRVHNDDRAEFVNHTPPLAVVRPDEFAVLRTAYRWLSERGYTLQPITIGAETGGANVA